MYLHVGVDNPNTPRIIALSSEITSARNMWKVKVSQIQCNGAQLQAPSGCAQVGFFFNYSFLKSISLKYCFYLIRPVLLLSNSYLYLLLHVFIFSITPRSSEASPLSITLTVATQPMPI